MQCINTNIFWKFNFLSIGQVWNDFLFLICSLMLRRWALYAASGFVSSALLFCLTGLLFWLPRPHWCYEQEPNQAMHLAEGWVPLPTSKLGFAMGKAMGELISKSELLWVISQPLLDTLCWFPPDDGIPEYWCFAGPFPITWLKGNEVQHHWSWFNACHLLLT